MYKPALKIKSFQSVILLVLGLVFVLLGRFTLISFVREPFSYIFSPIAINASSVGKSISNWSYALFDASSYIDEFETLKGEFFTLKSKEFTAMDYEEYLSLKENSSVKIPDAQYLLSKSLSFSDRGEITLDVGKNDGVKEGQVVLIGNVFVGVISSVDESGSLVRLPTNRSSSYEVVVLPSSFSENETLPLDGYVKSSGVISGVLEGIKIENIGINSEVSDGDLVVIRDERIGQLLVVGHVVGLSNNPAATSKSGFVSPIFDYSNLLTVFVRTK